MSPNLLQGVIFPLLFAAAFLILLVWLTRRLDKNRKGDGGSSISDGNYFDGGKNSDVGSGEGGDSE
jgi:hypothetical protein